MNTKSVSSSRIGLAAFIAVATLLQVRVVTAGLAEGYDAYVRGDYEIAYTELLAAARAGDVNASYYLGLLYWDGNGVERDVGMGVVWLSDAAVHGHTGAQLVVALAYDSGRELEQNFHLGAGWMREAARGGNADAQYLLGTYYRDGRGVVQNYREAYAWTERSVTGDRSNAYFLDALLSLGAACEWGRGLPQDLVEPYKWYAAAAGNSAGKVRIFDAAGRAMDALSTRMTGAQIVEAQRRASHL